MNIAIFADVHGKILLAFKLCARWQRETGEKIDLILQAGDLGVFPDYSRLDDATLRFAQRDPDELGFLNYFVEYDAQIAAMLAETSCPMLFVRGNHEDHEWLDQLEELSGAGSSRSSVRRHAQDAALFAIDAYERIFCLKSGIPHTISSGDDELTILGIGRVGARDGQGDPNQPQFIQPYERERLRQLEQPSFDLLLTHDSARDVVTVGYGMDEIRQILNRFRPLYHFYGHTGKSYNQRLATNGITSCCKLNDLGWQFDHGEVVSTNAMGILRWNGPDEHSFEVVDERWMKEYSMYNYMYL